jgi:ABC-type nickel/cobalt efflux system permease component RcnA
MFFKHKESFLQHFGAVLLTAIGVVFLWRGIWGLTELALFPDDPALSYMVSMFLGFVFFYVQEKKFSK